MFIDDLITLGVIDNEIVAKSFLKTRSVCNGYTNIMCSISGGADSDIMLDLIKKLDIKCDFVFFDTGLEYEATKKHIAFLEDRYKIYIQIIRPKVPIPTACKKFGVPFLSKVISDKISRLQNNGFCWENEDFETLYKKYPKCKAALRWWCNDFGENSRFNIEYTKGLKDFLIANPPDFKISNRCCNCAKKDVSHDYAKQHGTQLVLVGLRQAEGGARRALTTCFEEQREYDTLRPIFWYRDQDKRYYENLFTITNSDCYSVYGLPRTGCAGCPFAKNYKNELEIMKKFEPKLYNAAIAIFGKSYDYTEKFREFRKTLK